MRKRYREEKGAIVLDVTQKCNNFCVMCYNPKFNKDNPSLEEIKKEIKKIKSNPPDIYITGGEPTIRKDLFEIIDFIKKNNPESRIVIITNGRMLSYEKYAKKIALSHIDKIITEIHASTPTLHDGVTQVKGSFEQTIRGIKNLNKFNISTELRIVINKINYKDLPNLSNFIIKNFADFSNIERIVMFPINIIGYAYENKEKVAPRYKEMKDYVEKSIDTLKNNFKIKLYHYPFCVIDKKYWYFVESVTSDEKRIGFTKKCTKCVMKEKCSRLWKTYLINFGAEEFIPIKNEKN